MKDIVILGAGFAGVAAGLKLKNHLADLDARLFIIDKNAYHTFTPSLYEVATSEEPQQNVAIPLKEIFGTSAILIQDSITSIDPQKQEIHLGNTTVQHYDYLVLALGSEPAYFHIPGLQEHSIALKWLPEAVAIKNKIKDMCCIEGLCEKKVQLVIGGGGFSGTELAAEMLSYKDRLAHEHGLDKDCLQVSVIQGSDRLLKELDQHVSDIAMKRVSGPNITLCFGGHIIEVTDKEIKTDNGNSYPYDIFIWTGGVSPNSLAGKSGLPVNKRGQVVVNEYLQMQGYENIFAAGDIVEFMDPKTKVLAPGVAQVAEEQGAVAGENISHLMKQQKLKVYVLRHFGYVVPLRGHYAAAELMGSLHMDGFLGWILQQLVFLRYLYGILSLPKALRRWNEFEMYLMK